MKNNDIRKLSTDEINSQIVELKAELFNLKFQNALGQVQNTARIGQVRKTIARMKTILSERVSAEQEDNMERNSRKVYTGTVVSDKMDKTITVAVDNYRKHRLYGKRVKKTTKFHAHDESNVAKLGDVVKIMETRPLSKMKRFRLVEIVKAKEIL